MSWSIRKKYLTDAITTKYPKINLKPNSTALWKKKFTSGKSTKKSKIKLALKSIAWKKRQRE